MSTSTNLALPYIAPGQAQKHVTVNEALRRLDAIVQLSVVSATTAVQPGSPADGAVYILPPGKTGSAWGAMANHSLAYWRDGSWEPISPREGWLAYARDTDLLLWFTGTGWTAFSPSVAFAASDRVLGRASAGPGAAEEIACTAAGRALLDDADAAAQRATLGLGAGDSPHFNALNVGHASDTTLSRVSAGVLAVEGKTLANLSDAQTFLGSQTVGDGTAQRQIIINSLGSGAGGGSVLQLRAAGSTIGGYGAVSAMITGGAYDARMALYSLNDLLFHAAGNYRMTVSLGVQVGSPTGGDKGAGAINAQAVFDDNALLTCYVIEHWLDGAIDVGKWDELTPNREIPAVMEVRAGAKRGDRGASVVEVIEREPARTEVRQHLPARGFAKVAAARLDIDQFADFVRKNRRLPSFPGPDRWTDEFGSKMSIGDLAQRLWESVELLTVHVIEARSREKALTAQVEALAKSTGG